MAIQLGRTLCRHPWRLALLGYVLLFAAWWLANPPFTAPDEPAHYVRAVAVGEGRIGGSVSVNVPPRLWGVWSAAGGPTCNAFKPDVPATCIGRVVPTTSATLLTTPAGDYEPLSYAAPGVALRLAYGPNWGDRLGRLAASIPVIAAVGFGIAILCDGVGSLALLGVLLSITPMAIFIGSSLTPSGLEIASGFAFAALLLRMTRDSPPSHQWLLFAVVGSTLALTRTTGAVWVALDCAIVSALAGRSTISRVVRGRGSRPALTAVAAAVVLNRVWEVVYGSTVTQAGTDSSSLLHWLPHGVEQVRRIFNECIGVFGWLDAFMTPWVYRFWTILAVALLLAGFALGSRRQRATLALALAADVAVVSFLSASLEAATRVDIQGRHVLPFLILTPLLAAEIILRRLRRRRVAAFAICAAGLIAAATQFIGFVTNGRRQAVGTSKPWSDILSSPAWSPPLGWSTSIAVAIVGAGLLLVAGIAAAATTTREPADFGR